MALIQSSSEARLESIDKGVTRPEGGAVERDDRYWVDLARRSYESSDSFYQAYRSKVWAKAQDHFSSRHAEGSRYKSQEYTGQTRVFRPKSRSMVRRGEAMTARAFFSTMDVVNIAAQDDSDPKQLASAEVVNSVLNYRLTKQVPWFKIVIGQYQTAQIHAVCCSHQYWRYEDEEVEEDTGQFEPVIDEATGFQKIDANGVPEFRSIKTTRINVIEDKLVIDPRPPEDVMLHPGASWLDPINTSPYLIDRFPMTVAEVKAMADKDDPKTGAKAWREMDPTALTAAKWDASSSQKQKRDGMDAQSGDATGSQTIHDHDMVRVHRNFIKVDNKDWVYYTLGTGTLLSDPIETKEAYPHLDGKRPYTYGFGLIEAFRLVPDSKINLLFDLQVKANHIENMRLENILQVLHPKTLVRLGSQIDLGALGRSRAGIVMQSQKPMEDVNFIRPPDVTASAYQEQNMVNLDMDELGGAFSSGSVSSNRQLNETVGGMKLLAGDANEIGEYELRIFSETWVEETLRQCVKLVQMYESDPVVVQLAGKRTGVMERFGMDPMQDDLLSGELTTTVNVGMGSVNPDAKLGRFAGALKSTFEAGGQLVQIFGPGVLGSPGFEAISKEFFGLAGYKDGKRFLDFQTQGGGNPEVDQLKKAMEDLQSQLQQMQAKLQNKGDEIAAKKEIAVIQEQGDTQRTAMELQSEERRAAGKHMADVIAARTGQPMQMQGMMAA